MKYYISKSTTHKDPISPNTDKYYLSLDSARKNAGIECYDRYYRGNYKQPPLFVSSYVYNENFKLIGLITLSWEYSSKQFGGTSYFWVKKWDRNSAIYPMDKHTGKIGKEEK